jgi:hypothetical protein
MSHRFVTDGANQERNFINNTKLYIIHSMNVQRTEYQQILQTTVTDNKKVHILYPASIFLGKNMVASSK